VEDYMARPIKEIARDISRAWPNPTHAGPYLRAMMHLDTLDDYYGVEDAESIILYFLTNAGPWRGDDARALKKELRTMLKQTKLASGEMYPPASFPRGTAGQATIEHDEWIPEAPTKQSGGWLLFPQNHNTWIHKATGAMVFRGRGGWDAHRANGDWRGYGSDLGRAFPSMREAAEWALGADRLASASRVAEKFAKKKGPPNLRESKDGLKSCATCAAYDANRSVCVAYDDHSVEASQTCDTWEA
jgi:hypothetical protein